MFPRLFWSQLFRPRYHIPPKQRRAGHGCLDGLSGGDNRLGPIKVRCTFQAWKVRLYHPRLKVISTLSIFIYLSLLEIKTAMLDLGTHLWGSSCIWSYFSFQNKHQKAISTVGERAANGSGARTASTSLPRSTDVVTNDKFIFLQSLYICKTAEVHQDVKCFRWPPRLPWKITRWKLRSSGGRSRQGACSGQASRLQQLAEGLPPGGSDADNCSKCVSTEGAGIMLSLHYLRWSVC